jgi:asparagine synthase (glutamine-hydrolysing)
MCGIAGLFLKSGEASRVLVERMTELITHRGPDQDGFFLEGGCGLGMRRLSIIDLSTGKQPIGSEDGNLQVVFNGEIYNHHELRSWLESRGHRFCTRSDTEVLVHLHEEEGVEGIGRLRGMFAYAIYDRREKMLLLVRDRFGKKPLYCSIRPEGLYFGSELKCLRAAGVPVEMDEEALRLYFQFLYVPDPLSPLAAVRKLPPGGWLLYRGDGTVRQGRYWRFPEPAAEPPTGLTEEQARCRLRELFDESVRIRLEADVPLGAFLSGGIDSSAVVASMALQTKEPVKTFSIGFEEASHNELPYARMVAQRYQTDHHEIVVRPDSIDLVSRMVRHFDEPFGDSSAIPTFIVSEFAARHVKVALSGDGGDELFAGYARFLAAGKQRRFDHWPLALRRLLSGIADRLPYAAYGKNWLRMISRPSPLERYFDNNTTPYYLRQRLLNPRWMAPADFAYIQRVFKTCLPAPAAGILEQALYWETTANLPGDMLVKVDRMSMANSLEVRCPLLDHVLAEFASSLPTAWKMKGGQGKRILIDAMAGRLPPALLTRPKMGFGVPLDLWFRTSLREFLRDHLTSRRFRERGFTNPAFLETLLHEHQSGRRDNSLWLWSLLMLELWRLWMEEPVAVPAR